MLNREPEVRRFLIVNTALEGTFAGTRTFVVLYITVGLGQPLGTSTAVLAAVAGGYVVAALVAGRVGDRFGLARVMLVCALVYGSGCSAAGSATEWHAWYLPIIFLVAIAGGAVMTLAWGLLFKLMPACDRGAVAGLATWTKGVGPARSGRCSPAPRSTSSRRTSSRPQGYQVALADRSGFPSCSCLPAPRLADRRPESAADRRAAAEQPEAPDLVADDVDGVDGAA